MHFGTLKTTESVVTSFLIRDREWVIKIAKSRLALVDFFLCDREVEVAIAK